MKCLRGCTEKKGFTLIELIVVMIIMSVLLVFAAPRFSGFIFSDDTHKTVRWLIAQTRLLRSNAVQQQKNYTLNIDLDNGRIWVTDELMEEENLEKAMESGFSLPESVRILDVQYPDRGRILQGVAEVFFYKQGYADQAIIHIGALDDRRVTLFLQAFLPNVEWVEEYIESF